MKMHTVKLKLDINAHDRHETNAKVLRLLISGMGDAEFENPQLLKDLDSWDLDMKWDSDER